MTSGKTPEALREMRAILERHPGDPETEYEIGVLLQDLAGATFERIIRVAPDSAEGRELLGKYHEARGQLPEALSEYRSALSRSPDRPGLHYLVGNILWKLRDLDAAIPELEAELRINPARSASKAPLTPSTITIATARSLM
jgi:tetratricopeptide (TPR) repeat protein